MDQTHHVERLFDEVANTMRLKFRGWEQDLPHHGERGGIRERRVAAFLRSILPRRYGIGTGHIIDSKGKTSGQVDIVIYDALNGVHFPIDEYYSLFPCESVYAAIEVKSTLTASAGEHPDGTIYECVEAATKVKSLHRRINDEPEMLQHIVFAYQSAWKDDNEIEFVMRWFHDFTDETNKGLPDVVFVLASNFLLCTLPTIDLGRYSHVYLRAPLLAFASQMLQRLERMKVQTPDLWESYLKWQVGDTIVRIYEEDGTYYEPRTLGFQAVKLPS
jgi:hypothetical protein